MLPGEEAQRLRTRRAQMQDHGVVLNTLHLLNLGGDQLERDVFDAARLLDLYFQVGLSGVDAQQHMALGLLRVGEVEIVLLGFAYLAGQDLAAAAAAAAIVATVVE